MKTLSGNIGSLIVPKTAKVRLWSFSAACELKLTDGTLAVFAAFVTGRPFCVEKTLSET
jgi:hypothetical protein